MEIIHSPVFSDIVLDLYSTIEHTGQIVKF